MTQSCKIIFVFALVLLAGARVSVGDLSADISKAIDAPVLKLAQVSVKVVKLGTSSKNDQAMFELNPELPLTPASNQKLITTAAAIGYLGADFRFRTAVAIRGSDVAIVGDGDPTLGDLQLLRELKQSPDVLFDRWADALKSRGVDRVKRVLVDDSIFDAQLIRDDWPMDQANRPYVPEVSGLNFNANCLDVYLTRTPSDAVSVRSEPATSYVNLANSSHVGPAHGVWLDRSPGTNNITVNGQLNATNTLPLRVTIHDPAMFTGVVFAEAVRLRGVGVEGVVERDKTVRDSILNNNQPSGWTIIAGHFTSLDRVIHHANKDSNNLYTEALCKRIAAKLTGKPGTWADGTDALKKFVAGLNVPETSFAPVDGCGLSRANRASSSVFVAVLSHMFHGPDREMFLDSLSFAGIDGTLDDRFDEQLKGRVFAKSGYIRGVSSLSGYLKTRDGDMYAFSILINGLPEGTNSQAKKVQEAIVKAVDEND